MLSDRPSPEEPDNWPENCAIPKVVAPLPRPKPFARNLPWRAAFGWLRVGWRDLAAAPLSSLLYGFGVAALSLIATILLFRFEMDYLLFPALSGFMVIGPIVAGGLYEKSRCLAEGEPCSLARMIFVRPRSGPQTLFLGVLLVMLFMLWMRAAVLLYALFFGVSGFPGMAQIGPMLFQTSTGLLLLLVGSGIGALFAAFAFAVSVFAVPMLIAERTDAMSAAGISIALVWNNLPVMLCWGAIVSVLFVLSVLTGFAGLILAFPVLGHANWHAYRALRQGENERVFFQPA